MQTPPDQVCPNSVYRSLVPIPNVGSARCFTIAAQLSTRWISRRTVWLLTFRSTSLKSWKGSSRCCPSALITRLFLVSDSSEVKKLRCSFCRRAIHVVSREEVPYSKKDFDRRLVALLQRHSHLSATCTFFLGLNGDDKLFSADDIARVIEPFIRTQTVHSRGSIYAQFLTLIALSSDHRRLYSEQSTARLFFTRWWRCHNIRV